MEVIKIIQVLGGIILTTSFSFLALTHQGWLFIIDKVLTDNFLNDVLEVGSHDKSGPVPVAKAE